MKCRILESPTKGSCNIIETEVSDPAPGQVQIQGLACGICAWDVHVFKNGVDWPTGPGHEGVGRVVKVGAGVHHLTEGDWVTGAGFGFAEYYNVWAGMCHVIPPTKKRPEHWIVEPVSCVVTGLDHCNLRAADRIAVIGCGFMGLMIVQGLGRSLADCLIAIDPDPERREMALKFGATRALHPDEVNIGEMQMLRLDCVVDCTGNNQALFLSSQILRPGGRLNLFGWNHGTASFPGDTWHMNGLTVINSAPGSAVRDPWPAAIRLLDRGQIDLEPLVSHVVDLDGYPQLLQRIAEGEKGYMKGVVRLAQL